MQHAKFKVLLVLDISSETKGCATPLKRIWCIFECSMCLDQVTAPLDTAVVVPGANEEAQLVCSGLTKFERTHDNYLMGKGMGSKVKRERTFPEELVKEGLAFNVKVATASSEQDRTRILNYIVGQAQDEKPPREHEKYDELNKRMQGLFSQIYWHRALSKDKPAQDTPAQEEKRKKFMTHLGHLSKAIAGDPLRKSLSLCLAGCKLNEDDSVQLVARGLPPNIVNLSLNLQNTGIQDRHLATIADFLPKPLQVLSLDLTGCQEVSDAGVMTFVQNLNKNVKKLDLGLQRTNVGAFLLGVTKSEPLDILRERAAQRGDKEFMSDPRSLDQQSEDRQALLEALLRSKPSAQVKDRILGALVAAGQSGDRLEMNRRRDEMEH